MSKYRDEEKLPSQKEVKELKKAYREFMDRHVPKLKKGLNWVFMRGDYKHKEKKNGHNM